MSTITEQSKANMIGFEEVVALGLQKTESLLSPRVQKSTHHGERVAILQVFSPTEAYTVDTDGVTLPETKYNKTPQERRWINFETVAWAEVVNPFIHLKQNINPFIPYAKSAIYAFNRHQDMVIMKGMLGENKIGKDGTKVENFPKEHVVKMPKISAKSNGTKGFKDTIAGLILDGMMFFANNKVNTDRERMVVTFPPDVYRTLFDVDQAINMDYVKNANLDAGRFHYFAGVEILLYKAVPGDPEFPSDIQIEGLDTEKNYYCPMWCTSAVEFGMWEAIKVSYDKLPTYLNAHQLLATSSMGSARLEPKKIVLLEIPKSAENIERVAAEKAKMVESEHLTIAERAKSK